MGALRLLRRLATVVIALTGVAALAAPVGAHGPVPAEAPTAVTLLFGWTFEPLPTLGLLVVTGWWWWAVRRVNAVHPGNPVPRRRSVAFYGGIVALAFALL